MITNVSGENNHHTTLTATLLYSQCRAEAASLCLWVVVIATYFIIMPTTYSTLVVNIHVAYVFIH